MTKSMRLLFAGAVLAGCSTTTHYHFTRPNTDQQTYDRDSYQCQRENMTTNVEINEVFSDTTVSQSREVNQPMWLQCMKARGYTPDQQWTTTN
jgi:hypothetical protein